MSFRLAKSILHTRLPGGRLRCRHIGDGLVCRQHTRFGDYSRGMHFFKAGVTDDRLPRGYRQGFLPETKHESPRVLDHPPPSARS